jgi:hypothetical protein
MQEVPGRVARATQGIPPGEVLCCFDIDMTLTQPAEPAFMMANILTHGRVYQEMMENLQPLETDRTHALMVAGPQILVEPETPAVLNTLAGHGMGVVAFTACLAGPVGDAPRFEDARQRMLVSLGIRLVPPAGWPARRVLESCPPWNGQRPVWTRGVLCSNGEKGPLTKGDVLVAWLKATGFVPGAVVLVDDRSKNLESVEQALAQAFPAVRFLGVKYTGARTCQVPAVTEQDFRTRWRTLLDQSAL